MVDAVEYGADKPQRGDVIVFRSPTNPDVYFIKRVIGVPGDHVEIREDVVYINGEPVVEPYITGRTVCPCGFWVVEPGKYFVLGDNRPNSSDSRVIGPIPEENILGRVPGAEQRPRWPSEHDLPTATPTPSPATATPTPPPFMRPNVVSLQQATVVRVVDGDTIDVTIDGEQRRVRYYGIDAPDKGKKCFEEAKARNSELLSTTVRLEPDVRDQDEHGRLLRYVFNEDGVSIEAVLISEGLAKAWPEDGIYRVRFLTMEKEASEGAVGCLWK
jgi:endonuclease YncB( thermonuclease family)